MTNVILCQEDSTGLILESSLKVQKYVISSSLQNCMFLEISVDKKFLVSQKGHYCLWVP